MDFLMRFTRQLSFKSTTTTTTTTTSTSSSSSQVGDHHHPSKDVGQVVVVGESTLSSRLRQYTLKEVAAHCTVESCWMIILDCVYDLTEFIEYHPGGYEIMIEYAGADATNAFIEKPHTIDATVMLDKYLIGELVPQDRMFRTS